VSSWAKPLRQQMRSRRSCVLHCLAQCWLAAFISANLGEPHT